LRLRVIAWWRKNHPIGVRARPELLFNLVQGHLTIYTHLSASVQKVRQRVSHVLALRELLAWDQISVVLIGTQFGAQIV
jgi:hypothetical protein